MKLVRAASLALLALLPLVADPALGTATRRDLGRDEARGGHTLSRHVGQTTRQLERRLSAGRTSAASTYTDRATAEEVVAAALAAHGRRVREWAAGKGRRTNLALFHDAGRLIGVSLRRGRSKPEPCYDAIVVLRWVEAERDYFVLTSYPEVR